MKLFYHQDGRPPLEMFVVAENKDGTVDLAYKAGEAAVVAGCQVTKEPRPGAACPRQEAVKKSAEAKKASKKSEKSEEDSDGGQAPGEGENNPPPDN